MNFKLQKLQKLGNFDDQLSFVLSKLCGIGYVTSMKQVSILSIMTDITYRVCIIWNRTNLDKEEDLDIWNVEEGIIYGNET